MDEAAPQAVGGTTADGQELAALRWGWGEAYRIGHDLARGWWAQRRDGLGGDITADDPGELWAAILADYTCKPVPRDPALTAAPDDDLPPGRVPRDTDSGEPS